MVRPEELEEESISPQQEIYAVGNYHNDIIKDTVSLPL